MLTLKKKYQEIVMDLLDKHVPNMEVWAYGSRVNGSCHDGSDLDLVVINPHIPDQAQTHLGALRTAFDESNLPIFVDLFDWATLPEKFKAEIQKQFFVLKKPL